MSQPLPVTLDLRPGQALDCYLEHLAEANGITTAGLLHVVRGNGGPGATRYLMLHAATATVGRLACVARLHPAEVTAATLAAYDGTALDLDGLDPQTPCPASVPSPPVDGSPDTAPSSARLVWPTAGSGNSPGGCLWSPSASPTPPTCAPDAPAAVGRSGINATPRCAGPAPVLNAAIPSGKAPPASACRS